MAVIWLSSSERHWEQLLHVCATHASNAFRSYFCGIAPWGLLKDRSTRCDAIGVSSLKLGGSVEMIASLVAIAVLAVEKKANTLLMPVSVRRTLSDLLDNIWTKLNIEFYADAADAVFKGLVE